MNKFGKINSLDDVFTEGPYKDFTVQDVLDVDPEYVDNLTRNSKITDFNEATRIFIADRAADCRDGDLEDY